MLHFIPHNYWYINGQIYLISYIRVGEREDGKYSYKIIEWPDNSNYNIKTVEEIINYFCLWLF